MISEEGYEEDEEQWRRWRECAENMWVSKFVQVKSESESDTLFICKVTEGKMVMSFQMEANVYTLGNVNILIETAHLMTCVASSCQRRHNFSWREMKRFLKWRVPWSGIGALLVSTLSVSEWSSGSGFASGCNCLRFNIEDLQKHILALRCLS